MNEMRKLMETVENLDEAEVVDNSTETRRARIVGNFEEQLKELMNEYVDGAKTFGNATSPGIVHQLEKTLERATFRHYNLNEDMWPHDKPFPKKPSVSSDLDTSEGQVEHYLEASAQWLAKEAIELAGEVYDSEGPGEGKFATGAESRDEYVRIAAPRFLDKDYKKAVILAFQEAFDEAVSEQITGGHAWSPSGDSE